MRISIIGHAGSGKTTLAKEISRRINIPHLHIDDFWFEAGGHKLPLGKSEKKDKVKKYLIDKVVEFISKNDSWVSDGLYLNVQPTISKIADQIIFLDTSITRRLFNHLKRTLSFSHKRPYLNFIDDIKFFSHILIHSRKGDANIREFVKNNIQKVKIIKNKTELKKFLRELKRG